MDDNWRDVLLAVVSGAFGLLVGVVVARLGFQYAEKSEGRRQHRDDRIRLEDLEREERRRWASERRELYARFAGRLDAILDATGRFQRDPSADLPDLIAKTLREASVLEDEIRLIAPDDVVAAALVAWRAAAFRIGEVMHEAGGRHELPQREGPGADVDPAVALGDFIRAARADLQR